MIEFQLSKQDREILDYVHSEALVVRKYAREWDDRESEVPPQELPEVRPDNTRLIRVEEGWGRANACHLGALAADGDVLHWYDADMLAHREEVEAHARWLDTGGGGGDGGQQFVPQGAAQSTDDFPAAATADDDIPF